MKAGVGRQKRLLKKMVSIECNFLVLNATFRAAVSAQ